MPDAQATQSALMESVGRSSPFLRRYGAAMPDGAWRVPLRTVGTFGLATVVARHGPPVMTPWAPALAGPAWVALGNGGSSIERDLARVAPFPLAVGLATAVSHQAQPLGRLIQRATGPGGGTATVVAAQAAAAVIGTRLTDTYFPEVGEDARRTTAAQRAVVSIVPFGAAAGICHAVNRLVRPEVLRQAAAGALAKGAVLALTAVASQALARASTLEPRSPIRSTDRQRAI